MADMMSKNRAQTIEGIEEHCLHTAVPDAATARVCEVITEPGKSVINRAVSSEVERSLHTGEATGSTPVPPTTWSVCIFAHNEERRIARCLKSITTALGQQPVPIHVLVNGCTDRTLAVVRGYPDERVRPVVIEVGDKANAWNVYVHEIAPEADVHFFVDGDCWAGGGALDNLACALLFDHPKAHAAAAFPGCGRSRKGWQETMLREHYMAGNLYALRGSTVARMQAENVRLPFGLVGDDSLVTWLCHHDMNRLASPDKELIAPCPAAEFHFDSLRWWSPADIRTYLRRRRRYARRREQLARLLPSLRRYGLIAMPERA